MSTGSVLCCSGTQSSEEIQQGDHREKREEQHYDTASDDGSDDTHLPVTRLAAELADCALIVCHNLWNTGPTDASRVRPFPRRDVCREVTTALKWRPADGCSGRTSTFENESVRERFLDTVFVAVDVERPDNTERRQSPYDAAAELVREHVDLSALGLPARVSQ